MACNKYQPHVLVLPEDDANRQIATGFHLEVDQNRLRQMQVLPEAGGWNEVLNKFESEHAAEMDRWPQRLMVLVIDFDGDANRLATAQGRIPVPLRGRVFVIGVRTEPEQLRTSLGKSGEEIGGLLADDCRNDQSITWSHELLQHNAAEVQRLSDTVRAMLFS